MLASGPTSIIGLRGKPRHGAIRAKRVMAKSRAQSRCGNPVFFSSIDTLGIVGSGEDKSDQRRVSPNVVSPSYVVNLVSVGGAAYVRRPQSWGRRARRTGKEGPGVLGGISAREIPSAGRANYLLLLPGTGRSTGTVGKDWQLMAENPTGLRESVESGSRPKVKRSTAGSAESALERARHRRRDSSPYAGAIPSARLGQ
jgi:hypothetical protein